MVVQIISFEHRRKLLGIGLGGVPAQHPIRIRGARDGAVVFVELEPLTVEKTVGERHAGVEAVPVAMAVEHQAEVVCAGKEGAVLAASGESVRRLWTPSVARPPPQQR